MNAFAIMGNSLVELPFGLTGLESFLGFMMTVVGISVAILARDSLTTTKPLPVRARAPHAHGARP